jgi:uncharacterized protein
MTKHLLPVLLILLAQLAYAQMDDRFYYPVKKWEPVMDSIKFREINYFVEKDTVNTVLLTPDTKKVKGTIIYFHGAGGNVSRYVQFIRPLVKDGYQVYMIDFRGYGKSSGKPTHLNIAKDAQLIFDSVLQLKEVAKTKIIIFGASIGTQIATKIAADNQSKVSALVLDGTIASFTDIAADTSPESQRQMIRGFLTSPYSAKESIKQIKNMPMLFIHSKEDKGVPIAEGELVYKNATVPKKEMWVYVGDHLMAGKLYPQELVARVNKLTK